MTTKLISLCLALCVLCATTAQAAPSSGQRRGLVTTARCPYSCAMAGLAKDICREWEVDDECHVEDLTQAPGHRSLAFVPAGALPAPAPTTGRMRRDATGTWITVNAKPGEDEVLNEHGLVTSASCPYSCADAGLDSRQCREWNSGDVCFVEDLTQGAGHRSMLRLK